MEWIGCSVKFVTSESVEAAVSVLHGALRSQISLRGLLAQTELFCKDFYKNQLNDDVGIKYPLQ